ncbi:MAG: PorP/SprF family type IX secretion system membrane protein [Filimonas sp.]|nr:PorP/SprF family type IX secretion system membrane protein [Filimonas sp.]
MGSCLLVAQLFTMNAEAQDPHFSQFFEAPLLRNPSLAGMFPGDIRVQAVYRNQWGSVSVPYKTVSFNTEYKQPVGSEDDFLTLGLQILYDRAGEASLTTTNILPAIAYHKCINPERGSFISAGFMGGYVQRRIDRSKITTNSQYDLNGYNPALPDGETFLNSNYSYWDGAVGVNYNSAFGEGAENNYFMGIAYHHFNRPKNSFYKKPDVELNGKIVFSAGVSATINDFSYFTVQGDYTIQGPAKEAVLGTLYSYKAGNYSDDPDYTLSFGGFVRLKDAFIPVVKLDYKPFCIGLSYDANISELKTATQSKGGFELSITYAGFLDRNSSPLKGVRSFRF